MTGRSFDIQSVQMIMRISAVTDGTMVNVGMRIFVCVSDAAQTSDNLSFSIYALPSLNFIHRLLAFITAGSRRFFYRH